MDDKLLNLLALISKWLIWILFVIAVFIFISMAFVKYTTTAMLILGIMMLITLIYTCFLAISDKILGRKRPSFQKFVSFLSENPRGFQTFRELFRRQAAEF